MKKVVRSFARELVALYFISQIATGMLFSGEQFQSLAIAAAAITLATFVVKPIINILILPITLATLGLFKFLAHAITLFIVDTALPQFEVVGFHFTGFASPYFDMPPIDFDSRFMGYICFSILLYVIVNTIHWIAK